MKKYLVCKHKDGTPQRQWEFDSARDVAVFMWGKDFREYAVFVQGNFKSGNIVSLQRYLEIMAKEAA